MVTRTFAGFSLSRPLVMGIVNVTPDSFSDGGQHDTAPTAEAHARALVAMGADALDIGGESTRPGATEVSVSQECGRVLPVITRLMGDIGVPISVDTRNAQTAQRAVAAGAAMINDVSALSHDAAMADVVAKSGLPVCLMHAQGAPQTMQDDPRYGDVVLDVYDALACAIDRAEAAGIARATIIVDPGIGFGKKLEHNLALLRNMSLFHGLGCPIMLGASRKQFIGTVSHAKNAADRVSGSVAVALAGIAQGIQMVRVHDVAQTVQAIAVWSAAHGMRQAK